MKKKIVWLAVARSTYNDFLFGEIAKKYDLVVVYRRSSQDTHPWKLKTPNYEVIQGHQHYRKVYRHCKDSKLLIFSGWGFLFYTLLAFRFSNKKRVYWTDTLPVENYFRGIKGLFRRIVSCYVFRTFDQIWSTGTPGCSALREAGCPPWKIRDFPYFVGLDRKFVQTQPDSVREFRARHIHFPDGVVFLAMGRFILRKRYGDILDAMSRIDDDSIVLWLAGAGPEERKLRKKAEQLGLNLRVFFLGWVQPRDMDVVLQACDVFVHPSENEPFGVVVLDAMAIGKPIIGASSVGAVEDRVKHGINGRIFALKDVKDLARSMRFFIEQPQTITKFGQKARETAEEYPVEKGTDLISKLLK